MSQDLVTIYIKLVKFFGGQTKTAKALLVTQPSVNAWINGKSQMSEKIALRAERVTKGRFKAHKLCPSLKEFENQLVS
ncbi:helix-turn-helix domain-containing protein [Acinetobacter seifertii]|uniref:transcriptional regulator n=1 Tax=Acinetobacter seifertii TaxID=1530123 RepID=UPI00190283AA|nr:Cro/CI family transcriptional regulator [Acinetobacter seifertii]MBJ8503621.1 helix-turn-helix domain-containing protein [Acinetobacter seifertii]